LSAAAWQQRYNRLPWLQAQGVRCLLLGRQVSYTIQQGMSGVLCIHPSGSIKRHFKWKQREHFINTAGDFMHTPAPPGPDLRANIIYNAQACPFRPAGKGYIEARGINEDCNAGAAGVSRVQQVPSHTPGSWDFAHHFHGADDIERLYIP
jgi:hypothetical protein